MSTAPIHAGRSLVVDAVSHRFGPSTALQDINLDVKGGELVALLGPSGCGKTTLLRIIAGFIAQSEGRIVIGDDVVDALPPARRAVGIVFQNYALFPHMTIAENIAYGLAARGASRTVQKETVARMLDLVKLGGFGERLPRQLSGGQQQRVALARALAIEPSILLLDEPFAALDKNLRLDMQIEVKRLQRLSGITTILVTHDQEEALSMADRVAVLSHGRLEQFATPTSIYDTPATRFVNTFVGSANELGGTVLGTDGDFLRVRLDSGGDVSVRAPGGMLSEGSRVAVCLRPEHLRIDAPGEDGFAGVVEMALPLGPTVVHEVRTGTGAALKISEPRSGGSLLRAAGTAVRISTAGPGLATAYPQTV